MRALTLLASLLVFGSAWAQQRGSGGYVGLGVGSFAYEEEVLPDLYTFDESASSWNLYGGFNWNRNWGVEFAWLQTGDLEESFAGFDPDFGNVSVTLGTDFAALSARVMGYLPLSWGTLFGGIGAYDGEGDVEIAVISDLFGSEVFTDSASESGATVAFGIQWAVREWDVRLDYQWWDVDEVDVGNLGLSLAYRF